MKLVVISPESDEPREHAVVAALFAAGLERYHVRKPRWSREKLVTWLQAIAPGHRSRMVLHQHHELAEAIGLLGIHCKDSSTRSELDLAQTPGFTSRSCHDLTTLDAAFGRFDAVFFSPVFPSISKPGYRPTVALTAVADRLHRRTNQERRTEVIALGGVTASNASSCAELGFDGVAVLGALWQAEEPLKIFEQLQQSIATYAA